MLSNKNSKSHQSKFTLPGIAPCLNLFSIHELPYACSAALILLTILACCALAMNAFFYHYPGNNYFPAGVSIIPLTLLLTHIGVSILFSPTGKTARFIREIFYFTVIMGSLALATNAAQYTPFPLIDKNIRAIELLFHIDTEAIIIWCYSHPSLQLYFAFAYDSLTYQMAYLPIICMLLGRFYRLHAYYFIIITSVIIGFVFYYFYPTTAPASIFDNHYFNIFQRATAEKYQQIHHHQQPSTIAGGLIALPSFHVIWACACLYLAKDIPYIFFILLPINLLLIFSCVGLGWHYVLDIIMGLLVIGITYFLAHIFLFRITLQKRP